MDIHAYLLSNRIKQLYFINGTKHTEMPNTAQRSTYYNRSASTVAVYCAL